MQGLLYLTHRIPYPPNKGDKIRSFHLLQHLSKHYRVYLGTFIDNEEDWQYEREVRNYCQDVCVVRLDPLPAKIKSLLALSGNDPLTLAYYRNAKLMQWVKAVSHTESIQNIVIFSSAMAQYVEHLSDRRRIIDFVDVDSDKWRQYALSKPWPFNWIYHRESKRLLDYEKKVAGEFSSATFVSKKEAELFRQLAPDSANKTTFFNNGVDTDFFSPARDYPNPYPAGKRILVFTGAMDYWANVDAVSWFANSVFPAIHTKLPDVDFYIVGAKPARQVQLLADLLGIRVTGAVEDIRPYLMHAAVAIAPLRIARGIQNKVLEAMAMQKPVVVSMQAMEGIHATPGKELMVAGDARDFADQILFLLDSNDQTTMGRAARNRVLQDYTWSANLSRIDALLQPSIPAKV
ncbi:MULTISPECIES: TIGR03087 family PEP-CTERM/XrtA system glycosyltransferase [Nitrosomonas]|uniref:Sugar transferase (PEP-CTERM/EpsH1 system associated) n=2 Tax=Nitrosomonas eutropha TaxID=916 RepID=A0ABX5MCB2_9PROT|nr:MULTISPECIES: TIGR03087 family PEP-CTERM/XrtA system glycosyltransferase [Nitrosomonas]ABI59158.1 glycosyl transferase, group 1 [Nitrosomonas eutropha C91]MXS81247.1 TIGR03087 family PEP-CTERM/XrtA system glycosyltransferase [Nitrosomonas sp. GH22]PXV83478.1 sugar transferase (PEP-CTERM/EpsH1 system associated) [Nitrosomonas eutropha]SCX26091.1 sugar transferase, PEP-CTERM/EpsH1 system associated [Nitrosomonas eutropha]